MKRIIKITAIGLATLFILSVFSGCSKEKKGKYHTVIHGRLEDFDTGEPIQNARVVLADGRIITDSFFGWGDDKNQVEMSIDSTDENGQFYVELIDHYNTPVIGTNATNYYESEYTTAGYLIYDSYIPIGIYTDLVIRKKHSDYEK